MTGEETFSERLGIRLSAELKERVEAEAFEQSEPGDRVSLGGVTRQALRKYLDELEADGDLDVEEQRDFQTRGFSSGDDD